MQVLGHSAPPLLLYTDASFYRGLEDGPPDEAVTEEGGTDSDHPARAGWLFVDSISKTVVGQTWLLGQDFLDYLPRRMSQIYASEAIAPLGAAYNLPELCRNRDILVFIDNEAVCSAIIRGGSRVLDGDQIVIATHLAFTRRRNISGVLS